MKQQIDLMTGQNYIALDQLPVTPRNEAQSVAAGFLAAAAFCIGSTISPGLIAPRAESVTKVEVEVSSAIPEQRSKSTIRNINMSRAYKKA